MNDRLRLRFLSAIGFGLIACDGKEPAAPSPSSSSSPKVEDASARANPNPPSSASSAEPPRGCVVSSSGKPSSKSIPDCAAEVASNCCGPVGDSVPCKRPLREEYTRSARAKAGAGSTLCCYSGPEVEHCEGRPLRAVPGGAKIVAEAHVGHWGSDHEKLAVVDRRDPIEGARWLKIAADEHASIAAFAVVSLQLLSLGAPAELIADTHRAALDEIEHTRLALLVASAYLGEQEHAMGPLPIPSISMNISFADLARATFLDACVGETLASVRAREAAARTNHEPVARILNRIADEEEGHAELGFRTLAWLAFAGGPAVRAAIADAARHVKSSAKLEPVITEVIVPVAAALS